MKTIAVLAIWNADVNHWHNGACYKATGTDS